MKRIVISVTNDLTTDQRVEKTCEALSEIGYDVVLVGRKLKTSLPIQKNYKTVRFRLLFNVGFLFYAEFNIRLFMFLLFTKKNILFSNDLDTLLPNYLLSLLQRKTLVFDSHELFSEIPELVTKPRVKNFWLYLEKKLIPKLKNVITVSNSIKNHYLNLYGISATVVRNIPKIQRIDPKEFPVNTNEKKIILYQGAVNTGVKINDDLNHDGETNQQPSDTHGFGYFEGHFGMALLSKYPINEKDIRTFQHFKWRDMPNALKPIDPSTNKPWFNDKAWQELRLSSKSHWDIPINIDGKIVHILASHPTPPVFDGPEDRNGKRNHDEIRFWFDYINEKHIKYWSVYCFTSICKLANKVRKFK